MPLYCTKMFENVFYVFDIFALNCCPLTALHASGPKCCVKNHIEKISKFVKKCPMGGHLSFPLCVDLNQT